MLVVGVEGRRVRKALLAGKGRIRADTKGLDSKGEGNEQGGEEFHCKSKCIVDANGGECCMVIEERSKNNATLVDSVMLTITLLIVAPKIPSKF